MLTDIHTHSAFSPDGISPLEEMVERAHEKGLKYFGVSEHFDFDYAACGLELNGEHPPLIGGEEYFAAARALQEEYAGKGMRLLVGGEYGFCPDKSCCERYLALTERKKPDFIVNSVHVVNGGDCYFAGYFAGKARENVYRAYLEHIRMSLDAPYPYDIVAHIGYVSRNAPYENKLLRYDDFPALFDDILKTIIQKGKILEVNSSTRGAINHFCYFTSPFSKSRSESFPSSVGESVSPRAPSETAASAKMPFAASRERRNTAMRLFSSVFLRLRKAARTVSRNAFSLCTAKPPAVKSACTTAESTLGRGVKRVRGTLRVMRHSPLRAMAAVTAP